MGGEGGVGKAAASPDAAIAGAEFVFMCLGDDPDVEDVFNRIEPALKSGQVIVDHTTGSADLARRLAERAAAKGVGYLDAPVSGGQMGAENGQLTVMVGGDAETFAKAEPVMRAFSKQITLIGESGAGQLRQDRSTRSASRAWCRASPKDFTSRAGTGSMKPR